jgi:hypothetical protein
MTDTTINVPDYVTMVTPTQERSIAELAAFATGLLVEDLPQPCYVSVSQGGQEVSLLFSDTPDTFAALAEWAERFGANVTGCPHTHSDGQESVHCQVIFTADGVKVEAFAFITATTADTATT